MGTSVALTVCLQGEKRGGEGPVTQRIGSGGGLPPSPRRKREARWPQEGHWPPSLAKPKPNGKLV